MRIAFYLFLMLALPLSILFAEDKLSEGQFVAAKYSNGNWYTGKITKISGKDYTITFSDGDVEAVTKDRIRVFSKDIKLTEGERVLAVYGSGQMYTAIVKSVEKDSAMVKWEDGGYANLALNLIIKDIGAHKDIEMASGVTIRRNGSIVGSIDPDGTVRVGGSIAGKFESNGDVRKNGSIVGSISSNGDIRRGGSVAGSVSDDGTVRRNGSIIGEIGSDGTVRKNGSIIGSAEGGNRAQVAAYFFFFFLDE